MEDRLPEKWTVVILGRWNPAILTPAGVAKLLFKKNEGERVEVKVPMDSPGPLGVTFEGTTVWTHPERLIVEVGDNSYESLNRAAAIGRNALEALPVTPLTAVGYNLHFPLTDAKIVAVKHLFNRTLDASLAKFAFPIMARELTRRVGWNEGLITMSVRLIDDVRGAILFNVEKQSTQQKDLMRWLEIATSDIQAVVGTLTDVLERSWTA